MYRWMRTVCERWGDRRFMGRHTYRDLLEDSEREMTRVKSFVTGERIMVSEYNGIGLLAKVMALWGTGRVPCLVPPQLPEKKKRYCEEMIRGTIGEEALILFTSSTSGENPKGVRLSHDNLVQHQDMLRKHISTYLFGETDRTVAVLPWTHCYGLMGECFSVMDRGASMNVLGGRFTPFSFVWAMQRTQPTVLFVVPKMLDMLLPYPKWQWGGHRLRYIVSGGARLDPVLKKAFMGRHDIPVMQGYGMTEMSPMVSLQNSLQQSAEDHVGPLLPGVTMTIGKDDEIHVNGPNRFLGYLGEPDLETGKSHATGDCGFMLRDEFLVLNGRNSEIVKLANGRFVAIQSIEQSLQNKNPWIKEICLWWEEKGLAGAVMSTLSPTSTTTLTFDQLHIPVQIVQKSFLNPNIGTITIKGEKARRIVREMFLEKK